MDLFHDLELRAQDRQDALRAEAAAKRSIALAPRRTPRVRLALRLIGLACWLAPSLREPRPGGRGAPRVVVS